MYLQESIIPPHKVHREAFHVAIPVVDAWISGLIDVRIRGLREEVNQGDRDHNRAIVKKVYKTVQSGISTVTVCTQPTISKAQIERYQKDGTEPTASHLNERVQRATRRHMMIASVNGDQKGSKGEHAIRHLKRHMRRLHHVLYKQHPFTASGLDLDLNIPEWVPSEGAGSSSRATSPP